MHPAFPHPAPHPAPHHPLPRTLAALALATGALAAQAAPTGYEVYTYAAAGDGFAGTWAFAAYNGQYNGDPNAANIVRYVGTQAGQYCPAAGCLAGQGTVANAGNGDASQASSAAVLTSLQDNGQQTGEALAWADLATGRLGAMATAQPRASLHNVAEGVAGVAKARIADTLSFSVAGAGASTTTRVGVSFDIDGSFTAGSQGSVRYWFTLGPGLAFGSVQEGSPPFIGTSTNGLFASGSGYRVTQAGHIVFDGFVDITGPSASVGVAMDLWAFGGLAGSTDWAHTGAITLALPAGVTTTSASGVFLAAAVPEPQSWSLFAIGLGLALLARRRLV